MSDSLRKRFSSLQVSPPKVYGIKKLPEDMKKLPTLPLHLAAYEGRLEDAARLIDDGFGVDNYDREHGWTPIFYACCAGHLEMVKLLIERGANPGLKARPTHHSDQNPAMLHHSDQNPSCPWPTSTRVTPSIAVMLHKSPYPPITNM
jgi:hypothetical protein